MKKRIRILFFDMEFANGQIPGSVYSFGAVLTDDKFREKMHPTDLLINPDCAWNHYVVHRILAYPMKQVKSAPKFPDVYRKIRRLFSRADLAVGFAVKNDVNALNQACARYRLESLVFSYFDMEKLCKTLGKHPEAHGLSGYVTAYCGEIPKNQHRSDGDAYATMQLLQAIVKESGRETKELLEAYSSCGGQNGERVTLCKRLFRPIRSRLSKCRKSGKVDKKANRSAKVLDKKIVF